MNPFITVGELAEHLQCPMLGDRDKKIFGISLYQESDADSLTYIPYDKIGKIEEIEAGAYLTKASIGLPLHRNYIVTRKEPYTVLAQTIQFMIDKQLYKVPSQEPPQISKQCKIGQYVSVGNGSVIQAGTVLAHGVVIGENVRIGENCEIGANTVIGSGTVIGDHTVIGACCNIGTENFEYEQTETEWIKIPVVGRVSIGSNVRIGGNVVIEKGTIGTTVIGSHTQIENLVQIGHEVKIGKHCHIVACVGIAGWAKIGNHVTIYGQAAVGNHVNVGDRTILLARSGVDKNIDDSQIVSGFPAQEHQKEMRFQAFLRRLYKSKQETKGSEKR